MAWGQKRGRPIGELAETWQPPLAEPARSRRGGPRGIYVTSGLDGFYYRGELARGTQPPAFAASEPSPRATQHLSTQAITSARVQDLTDVSQDDFVASLNDWTTRGALQIITAATAAIAVLAAIALGTGAVALVQLAVCGAIAFVLVRFLERRRRRFLLMFDLGSEELTRYQRLASALGDLSTSGVLRGVKLVGHHPGSAPGSGGTRSLSFEPAALTMAAPPHIVTNLVPWCLATQGMQLYFFPERVLIRSRGRFASLAYDALDLAVHASNFVWHDALPHDAQVVGHAWLHARRDGGPDRRFQRNRQIPLVRTAYITLKSATGLEVVLQTTRSEAADAIVAECRDYGRIASPRPPRPPAPRPEVERALSVLGLPTMVMPAELTRVYRELAARNQPDDVAAPELRRFTKQRMREVSAAYHTLRRETLPGNAPLDADDLSPALDPGVAPARRWFGIEAVAVLSAVVAAAAVIAFGRTGQPPARPPAVAAVSIPRPAPPPAVASVARAPSAVHAPGIASAAAKTYPRERMTTACALRLGPSLRAQRAAMIARGTEVALIDSDAGWQLVRDDAGHEGWTTPRCWQAPRPARRAHTAHPLPIEADTHAATPASAPPPGDEPR